MKPSDDDFLVVNYVWERGRARICASIRAVLRSAINGAMHDAWAAEALLHEIHGTDRDHDLPAYNPRPGHHYD